MADNYLEKKMEEHRQRMASAPRHSSKSQPITASPVKFPCSRVFIALTDAGLTEAIVDIFRKADAKTAFIHPDYRHFNSLAQSIGARYYPFSTEKLRQSLDDASSRWDGLDMLITDSPEIPDLPGVKKIILGDNNIPTLDNQIVITPSEEATANDIATILLFLSHPASSRIRSLHLTI
ncbi:MAG: hypothetical protein NC098_03385 [Lachnoclostridium sp.]|nr:hypothetical protein [Lachnoclostridium sp.]